MEKIRFSTNGTGTTEQPHAKMNIDTDLIPITNKLELKEKKKKQIIILKWIIHSM